MVKATKPKSSRRGKVFAKASGTKVYTIGGDAKNQMQNIAMRFEIRQTIGKQMGNIKEWLFH